MTTAGSPEKAKPSTWRLISSADVISGLIFMAVGLFGLWASRDYPTGTAVSMDMGYVPRLLCWLLLGLGILVLLQGVRAANTTSAFAGTRHWRAILFVPLSILAFGFAMNRLGLVIATFLLVGFGSLANREWRPIETVIAGVVLLLMTIAIFVWGLELPIPLWPRR
jgi:hypothetical protein